MKSFPWRSLFFSLCASSLYAVWNELDRKNKKEKSSPNIYMCTMAACMEIATGICDIDHKVDRNQVTEILNIYHRKQKD